MSILSLSGLKTLFETRDKPSQANFADFIDTVWTVLDLGALNDGPTISVDCLSYTQSMASLTTAEGAIAYSISNLGKIHDLSVKKTIAGDCVITFDGTGYKFVDMDSKAAPASSVAVTLSDSANYYFEVSLKDSGITDGGDKVIFVKII